MRRFLGVFTATAGWVLAGSSVQSQYVVVSDVASFFTYVGATGEWWTNETAWYTVNQRGVGDMNEVRVPAAIVSKTSIRRFEGRTGGRK